MGSKKIEKDLYIKHKYLKLAVLKIAKSLELIILRLLWEFSQVLKIGLS